MAALSSSSRKARSAGEEAEQHSIEVPRTPSPLRPVVTLPRQAAYETLQSIIQVHFDRALDKKRAVDTQKKHLWLTWCVFLVFLALLFCSVVQSSPARLRCVHVWSPASICALGHAVFYASVAQTLKVINSLKYQGRCHKLTLAVATERLKRLKASKPLASPSSSSSGSSLASASASQREQDAAMVKEEEFEVRYQEPGKDYVAKFKRKWLTFVLFLGLTLSLLVCTFVVILCA